MEPTIFTPTPIDVNDRGHRLRSGSPVTNLPEASALSGAILKLQRDKEVNSLYLIQREFLGDSLKFMPADFSKAHHAQGMSEDSR